MWLPYWFHRNLYRPWLISTPKQATHEFRILVRFTDKNEIGVTEIDKVSKTKSFLNFVVQGLSLALQLK